MRSTIILRTLALAVALCGASFVPSVAEAQFQGFLKIPGLPGESTDDKHANEIELVSYTQTAGGKGCFSAVAVKSLDKASPGLAVLAVTRQVVTPVTVTLTKAGDNPLDIFVAELERVVVGTVELVEVDGDPLPVERVTLLPRRARLTYFQQDIDGSLGSPITTTVTCKAP